jgi:hypothetical protein
MDEAEVNQGVFMNRKIIFVLTLALVTVFSSCLQQRQSPQAVVNYDDESDFATKLSEDGQSVWITRYLGNKDNIRIPPKIKELPISRIDDVAFQYCDSLTSVTIPDSVTSIGKGAFTGCRSLTNITIPNSVTTIEHAAFEDCKNLTSVTFNGKINLSEFFEESFPGDLRDKFYAGDAEYGTPGTYTRPDGESETWTRRG